MKKLAALLLTVLMLTASALADMYWPDPDHKGHAALRQYVELVNETLLTLGEGQIDMIYEHYSAFASLGMDGADVPEHIEMHFTLSQEGVYMLVLRVDDPARFANIAAASIHRSSSGVTLEQAQALVDGYVAKVQSDPTTSFEEDTGASDDSLPLQGAQPRAYFAYSPNQYMDGSNWLQLTLIFPRPGSEASGFLAPTVTAAPTEDVEYEGYFAEDDYTHFEVFVTATPEPDSAAME
ncbi:MAG: hypothetical protein IJ438_04295 [Clostridia bacterium]|nr:hypothetical protein [Clostridia bacterium]